MLFFLFLYLPAACLPFACAGLSTKGLLRTYSPWKCFSTSVLISEVNFLPLFLQKRSLKSLYLLKLSIFSPSFSGVFAFYCSTSRSDFLLCRSAYEDNSWLCCLLSSSNTCPTKAPFECFVEWASFVDSETRRSRDSAFSWWWWPPKLALFCFNSYYFCHYLTLWVVC